MSSLNADPYIIRGHHLTHYADLVSGSVEAAMSSLLEVMEGSHDPHYLRDVFGQNEATLDQAKANFANAFNRFTALDPEDPVKITSEEQDAICHGCVIGAHCSEGKVLTLQDGPNTRRLLLVDLADMHEIARFKRIARKIGRELLGTDEDYDNVLHAWTAPDGLNEGLHYEYPLTVTAHTARAVLLNWHTDLD